MKVFFEQYPYPVDLLRETFANDIKLSDVQGSSMAQIPYVGYYFNERINDTIFILPKVFVSERLKAFDRYDPVSIVNLPKGDNRMKDNADDEAIFELSAWLYQAIKHFLSRKQDSNISTDVEIQNVKPLGEKGSKTIIEIIISLRAFQKKHRNLFTYISLIKSSGNNKVHWNKTISKVQPVFENDIPYYLDFRNKKKVVNYDEELIALFYSVLNYLSETYHFKYEIAQGYEILKPSKILTLIESKKGTRLLKSIRRKYFTDELVELWRLLYEFFNHEEQIGSGKQYQEKLLVSNFNLVFEDMVDQLISDNRKDVPKELWGQLDGKVVDHIYSDISIIDDDRQIYYIGDSKYYKETTEVGRYSIYKQFTYAKNVIQYNINVFNDKHDDSVYRYRDSLTEGYNITPNFFIRGAIDFNNPRSQEQNIKKDLTMEKNNEHFANRLFDRDTLFLQSYSINFMFVVASYVNNSDDAALKKSIQSMLRKDFLDFIESHFEFSVLVPKHDDITELVERNFKKLLGKIYQPADVDNLLILALDKDVKYQLENLQLLSQIEEDFDIYDYHLGTSLESLTKSFQYRYLETTTTLAAESNMDDENASTNPIMLNKYVQYKQASILFGIYKDAAHFKWINDKHKYNVRLGNRAGAVKRTRQVSSAKYLVLYEFRNEKNFSVYKLGDKHYIWNVHKMRDNGYPVKEEDEKIQYYLYDIIGETDELGIIDIETVLSLKRHKFMEDTGEPMAEGTPIYVYESEL